MIVLVREDTDKRRWKHIMIVRDARVTLLYMRPALFGWNLDKIEEQGANEWGSMSANSIAAFKRESNDTYLRDATEGEREFAIAQEPK